MDQATKKELSRRLEQSRRLDSSAADPTTHERLTQLIIDIEEQLSDSEAGNAEAPPE